MSHSSEGHEKLKECIKEGFLLECFIPGGLEAWVEIGPDDWYFHKDNKADIPIQIEIKSQYRYSEYGYKKISLTFRMYKMGLIIEESDGTIENGYIKGSSKAYHFTKNIETAGNQ